MRYFGSGRDLSNNPSHARWGIYTERILNNAFNPIFQSSEMMVLNVSSKEIGFIAIEIENCGMAVLPIDNIRKGYRTITLYD